jgi:hypothetical protein
LKIIPLLLAFMLCAPGVARAEGHGPSYALATPTLWKGGWSSDTTASSNTTEEDSEFSLRETIGYGINNRLQLSIGFPLFKAINGLKSSSQPRVGGSDVEGTLAWRFHSRPIGLGGRQESTLMLGGVIPTSDERAGVGVNPAVHLAGVTGYASRSVYAWAGGGWQRYFPRGEERVGDMPYATAAVGWRPPHFRGDYPEPDWRGFIEAVAEFPQKDRVNGGRDPNSGGEKLWLGPSVLGLYGAWGVSAGILFPAYQDLNGDQVEERLRAKLTFTYWF